MKEARYYKTVEEKAVVCQLCPHKCHLKPGKSGICQVRINQEGTLFSENYARISSLGMDPIEKKPLYHFYPGSSILSVGTYGCNFRCQFCQNWQISQEKPFLKEILAEQLVKEAIKHGSIGIAYTYSEPSIWFEYLLETGKLARARGLKNVLVSNIFLQPEPLQELMPILDGVNVDLKAFNDEFYQEICGGNLQAVLDNIKLLAADDSIHLELTTLLVTGLNDSLTELKDLFSWVSKLSPKIPLHLSRYFPQYKLDRPATPLSKMEEGYQLAKEYLDYVYLGNVANDEGKNTYCPECGEEVILRNIYSVKSKLKQGHCPTCSYKIAGRF